MKDEPAAQLSLLRHRNFALYWWTRVLSTVGYQMVHVAIAWQIYEITNSALHLGFVGLVLFVPVVLGTFVVGHVADHYDRRAVIRLCQLAQGFGVLLLIIADATGHASVGLIYGVVLVVGAARAFNGPTLHTIPATIMPQEVLSRAIAAGSTAQQVAVIGGPALGGVLLALGTQAVYVICFLVFALAAVLISLIHIERKPAAKKPLTLQSVFAGFHYIRTRPIILGAISLDLGAVLLGGVTALLPIFARDILETGPWGLGLLRSAPAVGALLVSGYLANVRIDRNAGQVMIGSVIIYGLATAVFGLSSALWLSLFALAVTGAADAVSVVVRHSLVQIRTPNDMLGRVAAVNSTFTGTTGSLGQFQSGVVAALVGAGPAAMLGGIGAVALALLWIRLFPDLWRLQSIVAEK
ncbi:MAG TPA: MFS transporter [Beijerinckiaceae bacterium]|jgi:MFS family permease